MKTSEHKAFRNGSIVPSRPSKGICSCYSPQISGIPVPFICAMWSTPVQATAGWRKSTGLKWGQLLGQLRGHPQREPPKGMCWESQMFTGRHWKQKCVGNWAPRAGAKLEGGQGELGGRSSVGVGKPAHQWDAWLILPASDLADSPEWLVPILHISQGWPDHPRRTDCCGRHHMHSCDLWPLTHRVGRHGLTWGSGWVQAQRGPPHRGSVMCWTYRRKISLTYWEHEVSSITNAKFKRGLAGKKRETDRRKQTETEAEREIWLGSS